MKARITDIVTGDQTTYVGFTCPCGEGFGVWRGGEAPEKTTYDVELDFERRIDAGAIVCEERGPGLTRVGAQTAVRATLESVDDDGLACLRLHPSCLVMVESDFTVTPQRASVVVTLTRDELALTPFGA